MEIGSLLHKLRCYAEANAATKKGEAAGVCARKTRREMGLQLGKLGIHFRSEQVEVDPTELAREALRYFERVQGRKFQDAMDAALLQEEIARPDSEAVDQPGMQRRAAEAYAAASRLDEPSAKAQYLAEEI